MNQKSTQRIAVITGASRGIGECSAKLIAKQGRHVVLVARKADTLEKVKADIEAAGGTASVKTCDIGDGAALTDLMEKIADEYGRLDVLVNNAGMTQDGLLLRMSDEQFDDVIRVNLRSAFITCRCAVRWMMRGKFGRIVNIASVAGTVGNAGQANYSASKAGLIGLTKSLAKEMASKNITANVVAPGFIDTAMTSDLPPQVKEGAKQLTPMRRFGKPEEIASAVAYLASDEASYTTGQVLAVDGGMTMC